LVFCAQFCIFQEWYLFEPDVDPQGYEEKKLVYKPYELSIPPEEGGEATVHYRRYATTAAPRNENIFYLHGNKGNMDLCEFEIEFMLSLGYDVWTMDYRGYGKSKGKISEAALEKDAKAVYDRIAAEIGAESIVIWGRSFGSGVAASVAAASAQVAASAQKKPKMLVLETPYWSLIDLAWQKWAIIPSVLFRYELPINKFLMSADCPIHLIHGTLDEKIPFNSSERLLDLCKLNSIEVKGHSIMCGMHNLRDKNTIEDFEEKAASILK
ncbi:MAG: alpha/beta hydrolase, partial [Geobacteraceae bacterium]